MAKVKAGLKKMIEDGRIPADRYQLEIKGVAVRKGWEIARCSIVEAEDDELLGRSVSLFLLNEDQGNSIGLQQLMTCMHWEELPEDEEGEQDTQTSLIGVKFPAEVSYDGGQMRVRPVIEEEDYKWQRELLGDAKEEESEDEPETEEDSEEEEEEGPESRKKSPKKTSKAAAKKAPPAKAAKRR